MARYRSLAWLCAGIGMAPMAAAAAAPAIVAAENFYADVARDVAGPDARIAAIMSNPDQDPHLFEASPSVARAVAHAQVVIESGAGYDPWMDNLLANAHGQRVIVAAELIGRKAGDNPHVWYDPATMPAVAAALARQLGELDPPGSGAYQRRSQAFAASLAPLRQKIAAMRARYAGQAVTATEPVFGYMAQALGLVMRNERFQLAVMNDSEPAASDVAAFENDLRQHRVRALLYNRQATGPMAQRMLGIAHAAGVPVVGVSETEPAGTHYRGWMLQQLDALDAALSAQP